MSCDSSRDCCNPDVYAWGGNSNGQCGDGTNIPAPCPPLSAGHAPGRPGSSTPVFDQSQWVRLVTSDEKSFGIKSDGSLWGWGRGVGDGTFITRRSPVRIGTDSWKDISTKNGSVVGIKRDGSVWAWGRNSGGILANGNTYNIRDERPVAGVIEPVYRNVGVDRVILADDENTFTVRNSPASLPVPTLTIQLSDGTPTRQATVAVTSVEYTVTNLIFTERGSGYQSPPTITIQSAHPEDPVVSFPAVIDSNGRVETGSTRYSGGFFRNKPNVTFSGGNPAQSASAYALVLGTIKEVTVTDRGAGYSKSSYVSLRVSAPAGVFVEQYYKAKVILQDGPVVGTRISQPGYISPSSPDRYGIENFSGQVTNYLTEGGSQTFFGINENSFFQEFGASVLYPNTRPPQGVISSVRCFAQGVGDSDVELVCVLNSLTGGATVTFPSTLIGAAGIKRDFWIRFDVSFSPYRAFGLLASQPAYLEVPFVTPCTRFCYYEDCETFDSVVCYVRPDTGEPVFRTVFREAADFETGMHVALERALSLIGKVPEGHISDFIQTGNPPATLSASHGDAQARLVSSFDGNGSYEIFDGGTDYNAWEGARPYVRAEYPWGQGSNFFVGAGYWRWNPPAPYGDPTRARMYCQGKSRTFGINPTKTQTDPRFPIPASSQLTASTQRRIHFYPGQTAGVARIVASHGEESCVFVDDGSNWAVERSDVFSDSPTSVVVTTDALFPQRVEGITSANSCFCGAGEASVVDSSGNVWEWGGEVRTPRRVGGSLEISSASCVGGTVSSSEKIPSNLLPSLPYNSARVVIPPPTSGGEPASIGHCGAMLESAVPTRKGRAFSAGSRSSDEKSGLSISIYENERKNVWNVSSTLHASLLSSGDGYFEAPSVSVSSLGGASPASISVSVSRPIGAARTAGKYILAGSDLWVRRGGLKFTNDERPRRSFFGTIDWSYTYGPAIHKAAEFLSNWSADATERDGTIISDDPIRPEEAACSCIQLPFLWMIFQNSFPRHRGEPSDGLSVPLVASQYSYSSFSSVEWYEYALLTIEDYGDGYPIGFTADIMLSVTTLSFPNGTSVRTPLGIGDCPYSTGDVAQTFTDTFAQPVTNPAVTRKIGTATRGPMGSLNISLNTFLFPSLFALQGFGTVVTSGSITAASVSLVPTSAAGSPPRRAASLVMRLINNPQNENATAGVAKVAGSWSSISEYGYGVDSDGKLWKNINAYPFGVKGTAMPENEQGIVSVNGYLGLDDSGNLWDIRSPRRVQGNVALRVVSRGSGYTLPVTATISQPASSARIMSLLDGYVSGVGVISGGSGYQAAPSITISGGATATAVISGPAVEIVITSGGSGYKHPPRVLLVGGKQGKLSAQVSGGAVTSVVITEGGRFRQRPTVVFVSENEVSSVSLASAGSGYTTPPEVVIIGGGGSGASAKVSKFKYEVESVEVVDGGSGYRTEPTVTVGGGGLATAVVDFTTGEVIAVNVSKSGSSYESPPVVSISGGGGSGCVLRANIKGTIEELLLTDGGIGYTSTPEVIFIGGGGTKASASAAIAACGSGASAQCYINGKVIYARVTSGGGGYRSSPEVSVTPPERAGGVTAVLQGRSQVWAYAAAVTHPGSGYTSLSQYSSTGEFSALGLYCAGGTYSLVGGERDSRSYSNGANFNHASVSLRSDWRSSPSRCGLASLRGGEGGGITTPTINAQTGKGPQAPQIFTDRSICVSVRTRLKVKAFHIPSDRIETLVSSPNAADFPSTKTGYEPLGQRGLVEPTQISFAGCASRKGNAGPLSLPLGLIGFRFSQMPSVVTSSELSPSAVITATSSDGRISGLSSASPVQIGEKDTPFGYEVARLYGGELRVVPMTATASINESGVVSGITITNQGEGYIALPDVYVHGGGGKGCEAVVVLSGGSFSIQIKNGGSGYKEPPSISVVPSPLDAEYVKSLMEATPAYAGSFGTTPNIEYYDSEKVQAMNIEVICDGPMPPIFGSGDPPTDAFFGDGEIFDATLYTIDGTSRSIAYSEAYVAPPLVTLTEEGGSGGGISADLVNWSSEFYSDGNNFIALRDS